MLTGVGMIDFPGSMAALPYQDHTITYPPTCSEPRRSTII